MYRGSVNARKTLSLLQVGLDQTEAARDRLVSQRKADEEAIVTLGRLQSQIKVEYNR